jgi:hypothetical protein
MERPLVLWIFFLPTLGAKSRRVPLEIRQADHHGGQSLTIVSTIWFVICFPRFFRLACELKQQFNVTASC